MSATEARDKLMDLAHDLKDNLKQVFHITQKAMAALEGEADKLKLLAMDEKEQTVPKKTRKVTYSKPKLTIINSEKPVVVEEEDDDDEEEIVVAQDKPQVARNMKTNGVGKGKGKRACSVCRQPGHRAGNPICKGKP